MHNDQPRISPMLSSTIDDTALENVPIEEQPIELTHNPAWHDWSCEDLEPVVQANALRTIINWYIYSIWRPQRKTIPHTNYIFKEFLDQDRIFKVPQQYKDILDKFDILQAHSLFSTLRKEMEQLAILNGMCSTIQPYLEEYNIFSLGEPENLANIKSMIDQRVDILTTSMADTLESLPLLIRYWDISSWIYARYMHHGDFYTLTSQDYILLSPLLSTESNIAYDSSIFSTPEAQHITRPLDVLCTNTSSQSARDTAYITLLSYVLSDILNRMCLNIGILEELKSPIIHTITTRMRANTLWMLIIYYNVSIDDDYIKEKLKHPFDLIFDVLGYMIECIEYVIISTLSLLHAIGHWCYSLLFVKTPVTASYTSVSASSLAPTTDTPMPQKEQRSETTYNTPPSPIRPAI